MNVEADQVSDDGAEDLTFSLDGTDLSSTVTVNDTSVEPTETFTLTQGPGDDSVLLGDVADFDVEVENTTEVAEGETAEAAGQVTLTVENANDEVVYEETASTDGVLAVGETGTVSFDADTEGDQFPDSLDATTEFDVTVEADETADGVDNTASLEIEPATNINDVQNDEDATGKNVVASSEDIFGSPVQEQFRGIVANAGQISVRGAIGMEEAADIQQLNANSSYSIEASADDVFADGGFADVEIGEPVNETVSAENALNNTGLRGLDVTDGDISAASFDAAQGLENFAPRSFQFTLNDTLSNLVGDDGEAVDAVNEAQSFSVQATGDDDQADLPNISIAQAGVFADASNFGDLTWSVSDEAGNIFDGDGFQDGVEVLVSGAESAEVTTPITLAQADTLVDAGLDPAETLTHDIEDSAANLADRLPEDADTAIDAPVLTEAGTVQVTDETITTAQRDALQRLDNVDLNDVSVEGENLEATTDFDLFTPAEDQPDETNGDVNAQPVSDGDDAAEAVVGPFASDPETTLNTGDRIDLGEGANDTLTVEMSDDFDGFDDAAPVDSGFGGNTPGLANTENVVLTNATGGVHDFTASNVTGVETYTISAGEGRVNIDGIGDLTDGALTVETDQQSGPLELGFTEDAVDGDTDNALTLAVDNVGNAEEDEYLTPEFTNQTQVDSVTVAVAEDNNSAVDLGELNNTTTVTATGDGALTVNAIGESVEVFDASELGGSLTADLTGATGDLAAVNGTDQDDSVTVAIGGDGLVERPTLRGGEGDDTLTIDGGSGVLRPTMSGFQELNVANLSTDSGLDLRPENFNNPADIQDVETITIDGEGDNVNATTIRIRDTASDEVSVVSESSDGDSLRYDGDGELAFTATQGSAESDVTNSRDVRARNAETVDVTVSSEDKAVEYDGTFRADAATSATLTVGTYEDSDGDVQANEFTGTLTLDSAESFTVEANGEVNGAVDAGEATEGTLSASSDVTLTGGDLSSVENLTVNVNAVVDIQDSLDSAQSIELEATGDNESSVTLDQVGADDLGENVSISAEGLTGTTDDDGNATANALTIDDLQTDDDQQASVSASGLTGAFYLDQASVGSLSVAAENVEGDVSLGDDGTLEAKTGSVDLSVGGGEGAITISNNVTAASGEDISLDASGRGGDSGIDATDADFIVGGGDGTGSITVDVTQTGHAIELASLEANDIAVDATGSLNGLMIDSLDTVGTGDNPGSVAITQNATEEAMDIADNGDIEAESFVYGNGQGGQTVIGGTTLDIASGQNQNLNAENVTIRAQADGSDISVGDLNSQTANSGDVLLDFSGSEDDGGGITVGTVGVGTAYETVTIDNTDSEAALETGIIKANEISVTGGALDDDVTVQVTDADTTDINETLLSSEIGKVNLNVDLGGSGDDGNSLTINEAYAVNGSAIAVGSAGTVTLGGDVDLTNATLGEIGTIELNGNDLALTASQVESLGADTTFADNSSGSTGSVSLEVNDDADISEAHNSLTDVLEQVAFGDGGNTLTATADQMDGLNDIDSESGDSVNITGSTDDQTLQGTAGSDTIEGGAGADSLTGNRGSDTFVFKDGDGAASTATTTEKGNENDNTNNGVINFDTALVDVIQDFDASEGDLIEFGGSVLNPADAGTIAVPSNDDSANFTFDGNEVALLQNGGDEFLEGNSDQTLFFAPGSYESDGTFTIGSAADTGDDAFVFFQLDDTVENLDNIITETVGDTDTRYEVDITGVTDIAVAIDGDIA